MPASKIPDWFRAYSQIAMLGAIRQTYRMIVVSISNEGVCVIRFYFDREPSEEDIEDAGVIGSEISTMSGYDKLSKLSEECVFSDKPRNELDTLDGVLYARME